MVDRRARRGSMRFIAAVALLFAAATGQPARADERVDITATDGVQLVGHLEGTEGPGIIFAHMYPADQRSWTSFANETAAAGFRTLTFDFRGYGESGGEKNVAAIDRDLEGAYRFLVGRKIRSIYLVGASMGGTASLIVASHVPVAGVATLSAPVAFRGLDAQPVLGKVTARKLFLAAQGDTAAAEAVKLFATKAADPKTIQIVPGTEHGTDLLTGPEAPTVKKALRDFFTTPPLP